jgi:hypothetical protein
MLDFSFGFALPHGHGRMDPAAWARWSGRGCDSPRGVRSSRLLRSARFRRPRISAIASRGSRHFPQRGTGGEALDKREAQGGSAASRRSAGWFPANHHLGKHGLRKGEPTNVQRNGEGGGLSEMSRGGSRGREGGRGCDRGVSFTLPCVSLQCEKGKTCPKTA